VLSWPSHNEIQFDELNAIGIYIHPFLGKIPYYASICRDINSCQLCSKLCCHNICKAHTPCTNSLLCLKHMHAPLNVCCIPMHFEVNAPFWHQTLPFSHHILSDLTAYLFNDLLYGCHPIPTKKVMRSDTKQKAVHTMGLVKVFLYVTQNNSDSFLVLHGIYIHTHIFWSSPVSAAVSAPH